MPVELLYKPNSTGGVATAIIVACQLRLAAHFDCRSGRRQPGQDNQCKGDRRPYHAVFPLPFFQDLGAIQAFANRTCLSRPGPQEGPAVVEPMGQNLAAHANLHYGPALRQFGGEAVLWMHHTFAFMQVLPLGLNTRQNGMVMVRQFITLALLTAIAVLPAAAQVDGDTDGDGRLSAEEFRNRAAKISFGADANGNGVIDAGEYPFAPGEAEAMDTNRDGKVQIKELQDALMDSFDAQDANGDGQLDSREQRSRR